MEASLSHSIDPEIVRRARDGDDAARSALEITIMREQRRRSVEVVR